MADLPADVLKLLNEGAKLQGLHVLLSKILVAFCTIGTNLRNGDYSSDHAGTQNAFGDHQLDVDIKTDEGIFFKYSHHLVLFLSKHFEQIEQ